jgi:hypothetical protein
MKAKAENIPVWKMEGLLAALQNTMVALHGDEAKEKMLEMCFTTDEVAVVEHLFG